MSIYPQIWETRSDIKWIFAAGETVPDALRNLADHLDESELGDNTTGFHLVIDNDGYAIGALIEQ